MCGIVAVLPVYDQVTPAGPDQALQAVEAAARFATGEALDPSAQETLGITEHLETLGDLLGTCVTDLSAPATGHLLTVDPRLRQRALAAAGQVRGRLRTLDAWLDEEATHIGPDEVERLQGPLRRAQDLAWTAIEDRITAAARVAHLAGLGRGRPELGVRASISYWALDAALDAIDRLEVRGRDSAGVHLWVHLTPEDLERLPDGLQNRRDPLFRTGSAERIASGVSLVYKTASVVGRLGDNIASIRAQVADDADLHALLRLPSARLAVLGHTRWASVGRVSAPNAHPLNSATDAAPSGTRIPARYAVGVLNGDIDNHLALRRSREIADIDQITTDAKLIPVLVGRRVAEGATPEAALAACMAEFEGSMAIGVQTELDADRILLGIKSGGQGIFVGLAPFGYVVASEIFGLVARAERYVALEPLVGEEGLRRGSVVVVDRRGRGTLAGVHLVDPDGEEHEVPADQIRTTELTTRDVAQGDHERYLEKELAEAPTSFRKTLRGRISQHDGRLAVSLPATALPDEPRNRFVRHQIDEIIVIGQGTAAVAAQGVAHLMSTLLEGALRVRSTPATELSAARLPQDMSRTCIVAISQSGTTTDTNRTVDLARARGATVLAIVNRRQSDLVLKSHGVLYTSDGRDIEMAVASTKAFYAQVAAGMLLGLGLARTIGALDPDAEDAHLHSLQEIPDQLRALAEDQERIAAVARATAARHTYWAVVGSGANRIAASEVRIKLSELCYRGVSVDAVEDKKHIDLSAESLVLLCAAGAPVTQLADLAKEVAIFAAHRNVPVVIADRGTAHLWDCEHVLEVPAAHPMLAWLLSTAVGHLFAYHAARSIDEAAADLRLALEVLDDGTEAGLPGAEEPGLGPADRPSPGVMQKAAGHLDRFLDGAVTGALRGVLTSDVALRLGETAHFLTGRARADRLLAAAALPRTADPFDAVRQILTDAIEELTRSIDSVKHQAKTVTVGTSRTGADLLESPLTRAVLDLGVHPDALSYATLVALSAQSRVVGTVLGATRYAVSGGAGDPARMIRVRNKTGVAAGLPSRADVGTPLTGTKKLAVDDGTVRLERGRRDGRVVLIVPEMSGHRVSGLSLLHLELAGRVPAEALLASLEHSGSRLAELRAAVTELDHPFDITELAALAVETTLLDPVDRVAAEVIARGADDPEGLRSLRS